MQCVSVSKRACTVSFFYVFVHIMVFIVCAGCLFALSGHTPVEGFVRTTGFNSKATESQQQKTIPCIHVYLFQVFFE